MGKLIHQYKEDQLQLAVMHLGDPKERSKFREIAKAKHEALERHLKDLFETLEVSVNTEIDKQSGLSLEVIGKKRTRLKKNDLLRLYLLSDFNEYQKETGLKTEEKE